MVVLFKDDDPKYLNVTNLYVSNDSIRVDWMEYWTLIREQLSEDDELTFTIKAKDYEKLLNWIKEKYPDYKPNEEECKNLWWNDWNEFNQITRELCMAIKAVFTVGIAYRWIYRLCWELGINARNVIYHDTERWEWTVWPTADHEPTLEEAENLVKERIKWFRKWSEDIPAYLHSFRVRDLLKKYGFNETVQLAGLLHDIVEDWNTSFGELNALRYPIEVVKLVDLTTHDQTIKDHYERWEIMMERLDEVWDRNAWAIKLADICDNVNECHLMPDLEKKKKFLYVKCPYFVKQGNKRFWWTEFYQEFLDRYLKQLFRLLEWEK